MRRLSGLDASFLYMETPSAHMHVALTTIFDPATSERDYSFDAVKQSIANRLHLIPPFRRRLVEVPFGLHHPEWVDDPDFDLDYHVRRAALPAPGGLTELASFSADIISRPLDRSRPLWELWIVEGLQDGHVAMVTKTHHAAVDGVTGKELTGVLLDTDPQAEVDEPDRPFVPGRVPSETEMLARAGAELAQHPFRIARLATRTARDLAELGLRALTPSGDDDTGASQHQDPTGRTHGQDPPPAPFTAPDTFFNTSITPHRTVAFSSMALDELKGIKDAFGVKLNDVVLAACAGALRTWLVARGQLPDRPLVALVPISVRADDQDATSDGGNEVSAMLSSLATDTDDPVERLERIAGGTTSSKRQHDAIGATTLMDWAEFAAPAVFSRAARVYSSTRMADRHRPLFNLVISNIPGPQIDLYSRGSRCLALYPMGPIIDGGALNITLMSYTGRMYAGLVGARETILDIPELAAGIEDEVSVLTKAARSSEGT